MLTVSDCIASFSHIKTDNQDSSFIESFPYCDMDTEIKDVSELLMVTGFDILVMYFNFQADFLKVSRQKQTYLGVVKQCITVNDNCKDVHRACANCSVVKKVRSCFANTLYQ